MSSRLRIFVKKRGSRRTGSRWQAILASGALDAGMLLLGIYGLYWLTDNYLWVDGPGYGWWPWFLLLIPVALVVYGAVGAITTIWENFASSERRAAVVQKATEWEIPGSDVRSAFPALPTVPPIDPIVESPGVRLAHRLPIDAASGWVSASMAVICLTWNTLVAIFVVQVIRQHLAGEPVWLMTWLMVPLVMAGVWTLLALGRQVLRSAAIGTTRVEVSDHPLFPGQTYQCFVSQSGRLRVRWFQVQLVCEEQAVYQQGTDTRASTAETHRDIVFSQRKFEVSPGQAFESEMDFSIPTSAMHSFIATHNAVTWTLIIKGRMQSWGEFQRRFPIFVYPAEAAEAPARGADHRRSRSRV